MKKINVLFLSLLVLGVLGFGLSVRATEPETESLSVCESSVASEQQIGSDCATPPQTVTISATKIVCDNEADLPNWGKVGPDVPTEITESTATDWVNSHSESCHLQSGWSFQYADQTRSNPGDTLIGEADATWTTFGSTDSEGVATVNVSLEGKTELRIREVLQEGYIPFTYTETPDNSNDASAELYCSDDIENYDNIDFITNLVAGDTYHCVAFNTLIEQPKQCDVVSDTTNVVEEGINSYDAVGAWTHDNWFDETILGSAAEWIWKTFSVENPTQEETKVFVKKFNLDTIPATANIEVAADNGFILEINDILIANEIATENNFGAVKSYDVLSSLNPGTENTIRMTVKNFAQENGTSESNPAGALYKLHIDGSDCGNVNPIDMCLNIDGYQSAVPEGLVRNDANDCVEGTTLSCDPQVNLIQNGDFENPSVTSGNYSIVEDISLDPGSVLKWLVDWVTPATGRLGLEIQNNVAGLPSTGSQHAELDGDHPVKIWQDIPTIPGKTYKLDFAYSPRAGRDAQDNQITVKADNTILGALLSADGTANSNTVWTPETRSFVATGNTTKVEFVDTGSDTSFGGYLDSVGLYCQNDPEQILGCMDPEATNYNPKATQQEDDSCTYEEPPTYYACNDGFDNSDTEDTLIDANDPACHTDGNVLNSESYDGTINSETNGSNVKQCSDGLDNDQDGKIDYGTDPGCSSPTDNNETNSSTSRGGSIPQSSGQVLGAETSCGIYVDKYLRKGYKNDIEAVKKVQKFLNEYMSAGVSEDGYFGPKTESALKAFQVKQANKVLTPWSLNEPTGIFYLTTQTEVNNIMCPDLGLPIPSSLIPFSKNPLVPKA